MQLQVKKKSEKGKIHVQLQVKSEKRKGKNPCAIISEKRKGKSEKSMCYYKGKIHVASDLNFLCESLCLFHSNDKSHGFFPFHFSLLS